MFIAVSLPAVLLSAIFGVSGVSSLAGASPVFAPEARSLAEAAGNRDPAEVVERLLEGERLDEASRVRIPLKIVGESILRPLDAAVLSEWTPMMQLLVDAGAPIDPSTLRRVRCIAQRERDRDTIAFLEKLDASPLKCAGVALPAYTRRLP